MLLLDYVSCPVHTMKYILYYVIESNYLPPAARLAKILVPGPPSACDIPLRIAP